MKLIACDTSGQSCGCALSIDGQIVASSFLSNGTTHSQTFMPMLDEMMKRTNYSYQDIDAYACTVGPGSFTGIRIGVSAVKAMAYATQKPAIPISSLCALAYPLLFHKNALIVPMVDARNNRVFASAYYNGEQVIEEKAQDINALIGACDQWRDQHAPHAIIISCGNAGHKYDDPDGQEDRKNVRNAPSIVQITPSSVAQIGFEKYIEATLGSDSEQADALMALVGREEQEFSLTNKVREDHQKSDNYFGYPPEALMPTYLAKTAAERNKQKDSK